MAILQAMVRPCIYLEYQIRKEYIVAELCKERYATINTCDGRCFLVRKLTDAQQQESEERERTIRPLEIKLQLTQLKVLFALQLPTANVQAATTYRSPLHTQLWVDVKDRPPQG